MASIYHYTSGPSLLGIINHGEFWATDINFLNDNQEHILGYNGSLTYMKELLKKEEDPLFGEWLRKLYEQVIKHSEENIISRQTYIISFSKTPDSIAHWFSYCEKNQGYCIEFEENAFFHEKDSENRASFIARFEEVIYGNIEYLSHKLSEVISKNSIIGIISSAHQAANLIGIDVQAKDNAHTENLLATVANQLMTNIFERLIISSSAYKEQGFTHEDERRLVLFQKNLNPKHKQDMPNMKFREKNGVIFPYTPIKFNRSSIKRIIIGPCPDYTLKKSGLLKLLKHHDIECEIEQSSSSLRFT